MHEEIGIIGSGGQADETESYLTEGQCAVFRALSAEYLDPSDSRQIDIEHPEELIDVAVVAAIGAPAVRSLLVDKWPGNKFATIIAEKAIVDQDASIGEGSIIAPGTVITTNVAIGAHAIINIGSTISHDCRIGDFVTICPGANIAGNVLIGDGVFVGIGAVVMNNVKVASGTVIGAGAVVIKDITEENSVAVGAPAKVIKINDGWLSEV